MPTLAPDDLYTPVDNRSLIAACDVLVLRALELVGKRIVRVNRARFSQLAGRPFFYAHLMWQPDGEMLDKSLAGAWTLVPQVVLEHGQPGTSEQQVALILDRYVRELVRQRRGHDVRELAYRLGAFL